VLHCEPSGSGEFTLWFFIALTAEPSCSVLVCHFKANPDLAVIWTVGQKMWQRDFPGTYENLKKEWGDGLQPIMDAVLGIVVDHFSTVASKYGTGLM